MCQKKKSLQRKRGYLMNLVRAQWSGKDLQQHLFAWNGIFSLGLERFWTFTRCVCEGSCPKALKIGRWNKWQILHWSLPNNKQLLASYIFHPPFQFTAELLLNFSSLSSQGANRSVCVWKEETAFRLCLDLAILVSQKVHCKFCAFLGIWAGMGDEMGGASGGGWC